MSILAVFFLFVVGTTRALFQGRALAGAFNWSTLDASPRLRFHHCYDGFECTRLSMPLDWNNLSNPTNVSIAVIRLPAVVPQSDPLYGGTIITNPGGPGGSGVSDLVAHGRYLQSIVDGEKFFDIMSFDPRGIHLSEPRITCFQNHLARQMFAFQQRQIGSIDGLDMAAIGRHRALAHAFAQICLDAEHDPQSDVFQKLSHISTAAVARDMLEIVKRLEQDREPNIADDISSPLSRGLKYLGFSYGTQLGNTFASMFPEEVDSMVLDGMVDSNDYSSGLWTSNLFDTEAVVDEFYSACYHAGPNCTLKALDDSNSTSIRSRVEDFIKTLSQRPQSWIRRGFTEIISSKDLRGLFILPAYVPVTLFQHLGSVLSSAFQGNYSAILPDVSRDVPLSPDVCPSNGSNNPEQEYYWGYEAALTYICNDGADISNISSVDLQKYVSSLNELSPTLGSYWAQFGVICSEWKLRPAWRFAGPYGRTITDATSTLSGTSGNNAAQSPMLGQFPSLQKNGKPTLFLTSQKDPVTPLRNAFAMSGRHPGSSVVVQGSAGHCAIYSSPSVCTKGIVASYFAHGVLPNNATRCEADCYPSFDPHDSCKSFERTTAWADDIKAAYSRLPLLPYGYQV